MLKNNIIALSVISFSLSCGQVLGQGSNEEKIKACGTVDVKFKASTDKKQHPTPGAPSDKALIYVLRPTIIGSKIQSKLAVDGKWIGANRGNNYFFFTVDPGEHYFCSMSENQDFLKLNVEAGKTYYLQQKVKIGFIKNRTDLVVMTEEKGIEKLKDVHLSISEVKQK